MKKILIALIIIVPIAITGFLGYDFFKKNFAHVHGIIMYSDNKDEADTILENNKKYIDTLMKLDNSKTIILETRGIDIRVKNTANIPVKV